MSEFDHPSKEYILAMDVFSSREDAQSQQNMFIPTCFRSFSAQTANGSDFFLIAIKTMKYVCYNSADNE